MRPCPFLTTQELRRFATPGKAAWASAVINGTAFEGLQIPPDWNWFASWCKAEQWSVRNYLKTSESYRQAVSLATLDEDRSELVANWCQEAVFWNCGDVPDVAISEASSWFEGQHRLHLTAGQISVMLILYACTFDKPYAPMLVEQLVRGLHQKQVDEVCLAELCLFPMSLAPEHSDSLLIPLLEQTTESVRSCLLLLTRMLALLMTQCGRRCVVELDRVECVIKTLERNPDTEAQPTTRLGVQPGVPEWSTPAIALISRACLTAIREGSEAIHWSHLLSAILTGGGDSFVELYEMAVGQGCEWSRVISRAALLRDAECGDSAGEILERANALALRDQSGSVHEEHLLAACRELWPDAVRSCLSAHE